MQIVPLQPVPSQTLQVQLNGQPCTLDVAQNAFGLFMAVYVGQTLVISGVLCQNFNRIVRSLYLGFSGDFVFLDTRGNSDPVYTGLGGITAQYQLIYLLPSELPAGEG